jgi:ribonuclease HI
MSRRRKNARARAQKDAAPRFTVFFDGCCEPRNPGGTAGFGALILENGAAIETLSGMIPASPSTSNNVAEYRAVNLALNWFIARGFTGESIQFFGDSMLVICQLWGDAARGGRRWRIRRGAYTSAAIEAQAKLKLFKRCHGSWIPREQNGLADDLSKAHLRSAGVKFRIQPEV